MKKFKYRGESYLKFVKFQREASLRELKKAEIHRNNLLDQYAMMESKMKESYLFNSEVGKDGHNIHRVNDNNQFIQLLKMSLADLSRKIQKAEDQFQEKHQSLLELQLKVRKIQLHKKSELIKFKKEYKKKSQKITDEINATRKRGQDAKSI